MTWEPSKYESNMDRKCLIYCFLQFNAYFGLQFSDLFLQRVPGWDRIYLRPHGAVLFIIKYPVLLLKHISTLLSYHISHANVLWYDMYRYKFSAFGILTYIYICNEENLRKYYVTLTEISISSLHVLLGYLVNHSETNSGDISDMAIGIDLTFARFWWFHILRPRCLAQHDDWKHFRVLGIFAGNSPVTGEFPAQRPGVRSFDVFFDLCLNKRLSKRWWGWWFETQSRPLWRHCNETNLNTYSSTSIVALRGRIDTLSLNTEIPQISFGPSSNNSGFRPVLAQS